MNKLTLEEVEALEKELDESCWKERIEQIMITAQEARKQTEEIRNNAIEKLIKRLEFHIGEAILCGCFSFRYMFEEYAKELTDILKEKGYIVTQQDQTYTRLYNISWKLEAKE